MGVAADRRIERAALPPSRDRWPTLVIPYEHDPRAVFYGHFTGEFAPGHEPPVRSYEVTLEELPIPGLHHTLGTI